MNEIRFSVLGETFRILTDEPELTVRAVRFLFGRDAEVVEKPGEDKTSSPALIVSRKENPRLEGAGRRIEIDGVAVEIFDDGAWMVKLPESEKAMMWNLLHGAAACVRHKLMARKIFFLHAGGVESGGGALVFAGDNDTGKTTLVTRFIAHGWNFLADDNLTLSLKGDRLFAHFIAEAIRGMRFSVRELDSLVKKGYRLFGYPGFITPPDAGGGAEVKAIFFLERGGKAELEELPTRAALTRLMSLCKSPLLDKVERGKFFDFAAEAAAASRCAVFRFEPARFDPAAIRALSDFARQSYECETVIREKK